MKQRIAVAATAMFVAATATLSAAACAHAEPAREPVVLPQADAACSENLADALTQLPDGQTFLECHSGPGGYRWTPFTGPYPSSDKWLSYGPELKLHGQGMRNPEILSGRWVGSPQDPGSTCSAEQAAVVSAGQVGPPQTSTGEPGQPLDFEVLPVMFSIKMTGYCLWQRSQ